MTTCDTTTTGYGHELFWILLTKTSGGGHFMTYYTSSKYYGRTRMHDNIVPWALRARGTKILHSRTQAHQLEIHTNSKYTRRKNEIRLAFAFWSNAKSLEPNSKSDAGKNVVISRTAICRFDNSFCWKWRESEILSSPGSKSWLDWPSWNPVVLLLFPLHYISDFSLLKITS